MNPSRNLQKRPAGYLINSLFDLPDRHIIKQDDIGLGCQSLVQFLQIRDFHLNSLEMIRSAACTANRFSDAPTRDDMVFLNQNSIVKAEAVILDSAYSNSVFLQNS